MFDKKKLNFWRLAVIFIGITVISLSSLWLSPQGKKAAMMNESMAGMAKMHLSNITIYDLLGTFKGETQSDLSVSAQNHMHAATGIKTLGLVSTLIVFCILPLLIGGTVILAIVWIK